MAKYQEICDILVTRIRQGEYADSQLPNLRQLAEDMGVSYLTARQAVNQLKTQGILASDASGRRTLVKAELGSRPRVALITPFWHISEWHLTIRKVVLELGGQLKVFACTTSTDTTIDDALNGSFDLIFIQLPETPPPRLLERMSKCSDKIVTLFQDYTAYGIRSLEGAQISSVNVMMQTLLDRGHRRIMYLRETGKARFLVEQMDLAVREMEQQRPDLKLEWVDISRKCEDLPVERFRQPQPPTAILSYNYAMAEEAIGVLAAAGYRVPDNLEVVSCYSFQSEKGWVSTIVVDDFEIGRLAAEAIQKLIEQPDYRVRLEVPAELIQRKTTKAQ